MVMGFFRKPEDGYRNNTSYIMQPAASADTGTSGSMADNKVFGASAEESQRLSRDLVGGLDTMREQLSGLLMAHEQRLSELGVLRTEHARLTSLLEYETATRTRLDADKTRLSSENKVFRAENMQLHADMDKVQEEITRLQAVYSVARDELAIAQARLRDTERELADKAGLYEETSAIFKRTQQELDTRSREVAALREKLDLEKTAHQILAETSSREATALDKEVDRLNDERSQLKSTLSEQVTLVRSQQSTIVNLQHDVASAEERASRMEAELDSLKTTSALEAAQLSAKCEAANSKAELVEKILATARSRNKTSEEEVQTNRSDIKQLRSELSTANARLERAEAELGRARADAAAAGEFRRSISIEHGDLSNRLKETETQRDKALREAESNRREFVENAMLDREEIAQLRTSLEIARSEIRQMQAERSILAGQLEMARAGHPKMPEATPFGDYVSSIAETVSEMQAKTRPIYDISEKSLRNTSSEYGATNGQIPPAE